MGGNTQPHTESIRRGRHERNGREARHDRYSTFWPYELLWRSAPTWRNLQTSGMLLARGPMSVLRGRGTENAQLVGAFDLPRKVGVDRTTLIAQILASHPAVKGGGPRGA